jgi:hypothetical protein
VQLSADRFDVVAGERVHSVLIVGTPMVSVLAQGGVDHLRRELEDIGFRSVRLTLELPATWPAVHDVPRPDGLDWLLFAELVPKRSASFQRQLSDDLRIADAWDARLDQAGRPAFHPYATVFCTPARFAGAVRAYATAYPLEASEC